METEYIGNMIAYERNRRGLTAEVVHRGICEQSVYSRIEMEIIQEIYIL